MADISALTPVAIIAVLYALGLEQSPATGRARVGAGIAGIATLAVALGPPLDGSAARSLTAHMVQHVLLLTVAPPLLVLGEAPAIIAAKVRTLARIRPSRTTRWAVPAGGVALATWAGVAVALQSAALVWHVPAFYDLALAHDVLHATEHMTFLATGLAFWWLIAGAGRRGGTAYAVLAVFVASLPGTALGAFMTLSTSPWYPPYATGSARAALQDQQLAGVVMWAFGGIAYVIAGAVLFVMFLRELERSAPSRATVGTPA
ncbi:MAG: cytochrome c oxidase assembly protein [Actinomycetia bacterium]|nr:cytochrome c oxidase assembly protein [Actinomycetes bacterium]